MAPKAKHAKSRRRRSTAQADTRAALLNAAAQVFAEAGFRSARVREIARRAGANLAAINYHFGGKKRLYVAALQEHAAQTVRRLPIVTDDKLDVEERLRQTVHNILSRFLGAEGRASVLPRLMVSELAHPTEAIEAMVQNVVRPQFQMLSALVGEILGPKAAAEQVKLATFSTIGQCMFYLFARPIASRLAPELYEDRALERLAAHIAAFSLSGLRGLRGAAEIVK